MSEKWSARLFRTILYNRPALLKTCISEARENGVGINEQQRSFFNETPLQYAIACNCLVSVKTLIKQGANVDLGRPRSPLIYCIRLKRLAMAKYLIQKGADTNQPDIAGKTPLFWAISIKNEDFVELLLDNGADLTTYPYLIDAIEKDNSEIIQLLLRKGASANFQDNNGLTPLLKCIQKHPLNFKIFDKLLHHNADVNLTTKQGTVLLKYTEMDDIRLVQKILERKADVNKSSNDGLYPIMVAIDHSYFHMVKLLVDSGADLAVSDSRGDSPLLKAAGGKSLSIVEYLVCAGADLNKVNNFHETPLSRALSPPYNFRIYDFLINEGADEGLMAREAALMEKRYRVRVFIL